MKWVISLFIGDCHFHVPQRFYAGMYGSDAYILEFVVITVHENTVLFLHNEDGHVCISA